MKLFVAHDKQGNIVAVGMPNPDMKGDVGIIADAQHTVSEIEIKEKRTVFENQDKAMTRLVELAEQFQVDSAPRKAKLVRRKLRTK